MIKRSFSIITLLILCVYSYAQVSIVGANSTNSFPLSFGRLLNDDNDATSVKTASHLFAGDVGMVKGESPAVTTKLSPTPYLIIAGTVDKNRWIKALAADNKININSLKGQ